MHPGVKLRHIRAFLDIAAEGGLTSVARAQGISQPALSRTLAELEDLLGQPLFVRQKRRLVLTEGGRLFRRHAALALESLEAGAAALRPGTSGSLRIGVLPTAATRMVPAVILRFRELRPEVLLRVETGPHHHLIRLLREGGIDLMVGRRDHPMAARPVIEALKASALILPPETALIRRPVNDYLASLGLVGIQPAVETVALAVGRGICLASDALWFISRGVVAEELDRGMLIEFQLGARFLSGAVGITRRQSAAAPGLAAFEEIARQLAAQMPGARAG